MAVRVIVGESKRNVISLGRADRAQPRVDIAGVHDQNHNGLLSDIVRHLLAIFPRSSREEFQ